MNALIELRELVEWFYQTDSDICQRRIRENVRARDAIVHLADCYNVAPDKDVAELLHLDRTSVIAARKRIAIRLEPDHRGRIRDMQFKRELETLETYANGIIA